MATVRERYEEISKRLAAVEFELLTLRDNCEHSFADRKACSNTGNYDPSANCYWYEFRCGDCGKFWREDQ